MSSISFCETMVQFATQRAISDFWDVGQFGIYQHDKDSLRNHSTPPLWVRCVMIGMCFLVFCLSSWPFLLLRLLQECKKTNDGMFRLE
jgi:hypothetical protein